MYFKNQILKYLKTNAFKYKCIWPIPDIYLYIHIEVIIYMHGMNKHVFPQIISQLEVQIS